MHPLADGPHWQLTWASVKGKSHQSAGLPNQDWVEVRTTPGGNIIAAGISDGAGSAPHSQVGARTTCERMTPCLLEIGIQLHHSGVDHQYVEDKIKRALAEVRETLSQKSPRLSDFHCTFVGCVLTNSTGLVCQIGDSVALSTKFAGLEGRELDFFPDSQCHLFQPDRGEYANETHFVTETDWAAHLRITPLDMVNVDALVLMSDGAMDIATSRGKVFRGFISNLIGKLLTVRQVEERARTLTQWLGDSRAHRATADDKTLFVAIRHEHLALGDRPFRVDAAAAAAEPAADLGSTTDPRDSPVVPQGDPDPDPHGQHVGTALTPQDSLLERVVVRFVLPVMFLILLALFAMLFYPEWLDGLSLLTPQESSRSDHAPRYATPEGHAPRHKPTTQNATPSPPLVQESPPIVSHLPAELVPVPSEQMEVVVSKDAPTQLRLRMIAGSKAELVSVSSSEASELQVVTGSAGCSPQDPMTSSQPYCVLQLFALKSKKKQNSYRLEVVYREPGDSQTRTLSLPVRLAQGERP